MLDLLRGHKVKQTGDDQLHKCVQIKEIVSDFIELIFSLLEVLFSFYFETECDK